MDFPAAPHNVSVISPYSKNVLDIRWDNPGVLPENSQFRVVGVNIYRSFDNQFGSFHKLNSIPVGATFYRDQAVLDVKLDEDVSSLFVTRGTDELGRWIFKVANIPMMKSANTTDFKFANHTSDITVKIDGVEVKAWKVNGELGVVELITAPIFDSVTQRYLEPLLPSPNSLVTCTYRTPSNGLTTVLAQRNFYRVTTVVDNDGGYLETPLDQVVSTSSINIEKMDWIWREAVRRNRWILEQGGERVKIFLHRYTGIRCSCWNSTKNQPLSDCLHCFGTSILGGYDGPYDMIISPDESAKKKEQSIMGRRLSHNWEAWTGPTPLLSHRDFIVRQNNDRYTIGAPSVPSARGMVLQQHFTMNYVDSKDILYSVPVTGTELLSFPQTRTQSEGSNVYPEVTDKPTVPAERQERGRTVVWENITY
jgi:hypothetical protein